MRVLITLLILLLTINSCSALKKKEDLSSCKKGWKSLEEKKTDEALELFNQCIKNGNLTKSSLARTYRNIGITYNQIKEYDKAIEYFDKAISLNPDDIFNDYVNKGNSWDMLKNPEKALQNYNQAIASNKLCATPRIKRGNHIQAFFSTGCGQIYYNRGVYYEGQKDFTEAKKDFITAYQFGLRNRQVAQRFVAHKINPKIID